MKSARRALCVPTDVCTIKNALPDLLQRIRKAPGGWEFNELQEVKAEMAALVNSNEIQSDREKGRLKINPDQIQLTHTAEPVDQKNWRVRIELDAPDGFLAQVAHVTYQRHPTFKTRFKDVTVAPFVDSFKCWGAFTIKAVIHLDDGQTLNRQRFLTLEAENE